MQRRKRKSLVLGILSIILVTVSIVFSVLEYKGLYIAFYILGFVFFTWMFIYNLIYGRCPNCRKRNMIVKKCPKCGHEYED